MELKKNYFASRMRKVRAERRKRGLCIRCGKSRETTFICCNKCRDDTKKRAKEKRPGHGVKPRVNRITNNSLQRAMLDAEYSSFKLAKDIGVSSRTIERWLFEGSTPQHGNALKVNEILKIEVYKVEDYDK